MENQTNDEEQINMHEEMRRAFSLLSGKWKLEIMWLLNQRIYRFGELRKAIPGITQHMLTAQLRESYAGLERKVELRAAYGRSIVTALARVTGNYAICPVSGHAGLIQKARCQVLTDFCHAFGAGHCA